ncbi:MAG TPA: hypothetical protein PLK30_03345 [Blastocatellia bacterium]|nr:hypothetical protein [Blastocatellia bacterium]
MHCPQCGQQPPTEQTRFCTHCGCALDDVRDFLATGLPPGSVRQRDINLGASLMLVGAIKSLLGAGFFNLPIGSSSVMLSAAFFALLQLFFQLSPRQKGLSLGATLMFTSSLAALLIGSVTGGFGALGVMTVSILIILFWQRLSAEFQKLFFDKTESKDFRAIPQSKVAASLPPEQSPAVETNRVRQQDLSEPNSIAEGTTQALSFTNINEQ